jgi:hypothetical protein
MWMFASAILNELSHSINRISEGLLASPLSRWKAPDGGRDERSFRRTRGATLVYEHKNAIHLSAKQDCRHKVDLYLYENDRVFKREREH